LSAYTIVLVLMRNHLFIWSVFSPKWVFLEVDEWLRQKIIQWFIEVITNYDFLALCSAGTFMSVQQLHVSILGSSLLSQLWFIHI
jgi:hypothetical protein